MDDFLISNGKLISPKREKICTADVSINDGIITEVSSTNTKKRSYEKKIDATGLYVSPSFIDLQVNGGKGVDLLSATSSEVERFSQFLMKTGTTSFLGTIITNPIESMKESMETLISVNPKNFLGIHLEGPFLSMKERGTHNPDFIRKPSKSLFNKLVKEHREFIKFVTFAPELPNAHKLLQEIKAIDAVPSLGHTDASYDEALKAIKEGAISFTHLYNGMRGFHHRKPGCIGAAFDSQAFVGLIVDGYHLHPSAIRLASKVKGFDKLYLVSDAIAAAGMEPGKYNLGDQTIVVKDEIAKLPNGTIAGSTLTMEKAVKNLTNLTKASLPQAVKTASLNPAKVLGIDHRKGTIEKGKDADILLFDKNLKIEYTLKNGEIVYTRNKT